MRLMSLGLALTALGVAGLAHSAAAENTVAIPSFVEETASAGIDSVYAGEWEYMVGGGVATFDCNDDGFADMLLAGGTSPAKFYRNTSTRGGALHFEAQTSGLELDKVTGAYPLDIDSDGITDLVLLRVGENVVMRGLGDCRFERANEAWGFDGGDAWSTAFAATWERGADLAHAGDRQLHQPPRGDVAVGVLHRQLVAPARWRWQTQRQFAAPLALKPSFARFRCCSPTGTGPARHPCASPTTANITKAARSSSGTLIRTQAPALYTDKEGWKPLRIWGMGIASYDLDFDGYPEYFLTSMADNKLQTLAASRRTASRRPPSTTWPLPKVSPRIAPTWATTCGPAPPGMRSLKT